MAEQRDNLRMNLHVLYTQLTEMIKRAKEERKRRDLEIDPDKLFSTLENKLTLLETVLAKIHIRNDRVLFLVYVINQLKHAVINVWPYIANSNKEDGDALEKTYLCLNFLQAEIAKLDAEQARTYPLLTLIESQPTNQFLKNLLEDVSELEPEPLAAVTTSTNLTKLPFYQEAMQIGWMKVHLAATQIGFAFATTEPNSKELQRLSSYISLREVDLEKFTVFLQKVETIQPTPAQLQRLGEGYYRKKKDAAVNEFLANQQNSAFLRDGWKRGQIAKFNTLFEFLTTVIPIFKGLVSQVQSEINKKTARATNYGLLERESLWAKTPTNTAPEKTPQIELQLNKRFLSAEDDMSGWDENDSDEERHDVKRLCFMLR